MNNLVGQKPKKTLGSLLTKKAVKNRSGKVQFWQFSHRLSESSFIVMGVLGVHGFIAMS
jgi:hypothetical protein